MTQWDSIVKFPKNKGNSCPNAPPTEPCDVDCEYKDKSDWSACNKETGTRSACHTQRSTRLSTTAQLCPTTEENCDVDCEGDWSVVSACNKKTGKKTQTYNVTQRKWHNGKACPHEHGTTKTEDCPVDCEISMKNVPWQCSDNFEGPYGSGKRQKYDDSETPATLVKANRVLVEPLNGGKSCAEVANRNLFYKSSKTCDAYFEEKKKEAETRASAIADRERKVRDETLRISCQPDTATFRANAKSELF